MISPSSTNPAVTQVGDYIFRVCFIDPFQGDVMARFAKDSLHFDRVAVFKDQARIYEEGDLKPGMIRVGAKFGMTEDQVMAWALPRAANQFWMLSEPERATAFLQNTRKRVSTTAARLSRRRAAR